MPVKGPVRGFYYAHRAIVVELESLLDKAAKLDAGNTRELEDFKNRINFMKRFFKVHEDGEEVSLYPAASRLKEGISSPFEWDRHRSEEYLQVVSGAVDELMRSRDRSAVLKVVKGVAALRAFLGAHENKEDEILLPLIDAGLDPMEQGQVLGKAMSTFPQSEIEELQKFLMKRITQDDRLDFLRMMKQGAPLEKFQETAKWMREALTEKEWNELRTKMPELK